MALPIFIQLRKITKLVYSSRPAYNDFLNYNVPQKDKVTDEGNNYPQSPMKTNWNESDPNSKTQVNINIDDFDLSLPPHPTYDALYSIDSMKEILKSLEKTDNDDYDNVPLALANDSENVNIRLNATDELHNV